MNKLFRYLVFATAISVAALATTLNASAQNLKEGTYEEKNGIAYSKSATLQPDGSYVIDLEAFVTGEVKITTQSVPSDVILVLDVSTSMKNSYNGTTRLAALKSAVNTFLDIIYQNDQDARKIDPDYEGNRVAILTYSSTVTDVTSQSWYNVNGGVTSLKTRVDNFSTSTGTRPELGLSNAIDKYLDGSPNTARSNATLAVVLFTDGYPVDGNSSNVSGQSGASTGDRFDYLYANNTIYQANILKNTYKANLFTVGLISEVTADNNVAYANYSRVLYLMNLVSSNYPNATISQNSTSDWNFTYNTRAISVSGLSTGNVDEKGKYFQLVDDNTDLSTIFKSIAEASGGSASEIPSGAEVTVDVVSASFAVPTGGSDAIEVLYAPTNGTTTIDGQEYLTFGDAKVPSAYGLTGITVDVDEENNTVKTSGFDFSENWCGKDESSSTGYHGYKQIIRFTITVKDEAVGGPNVYTNEAGSGIYVDGVQVATFNRPTVKMPVNIWIQKQGLVGEDSAVFTLARAKYVAGEIPTDDKWENFTKVVVNKDNMDENGIVKISGLDPNYYYRIKEDAWAWGYTYIDGILYTIGDNVQNPFLFRNEPNNPKKAEAVLRNIFKEVK